MKIDAFYSDPHFGHRFVSDLRGFSTVEAQTEYLVAEYNGRTQSTGTVLWLGDAFFCSQAEAQRIMADLSGTKILIRGNHDWAKPPGWFVDAGFSLVVDGEVAVPGFGAMASYACHFPWAGTAYGAEDSGDDRYAAKRPPKRSNAVLLHGHSHSPSQGEGRRVHVGVDAWALGPVRRETVEALLQNRGVL